MDKELFFQKLHKELSIKYKTSPAIISSIRSSKRTIPEIIQRANEQLTLPHYGRGKKRALTRRYGKQHYYNLIRLISNITEENLLDIRQQTIHDKPAHV